MLSVPGVLNAARYEAVSSGPKHLACYELESPAVVESEAFTSRPRTEWWSWYSGIYVPNYEKVPGCIRGRRWKATRGSPKYAVVYEFENEKVSSTPEWEAQRDADPSTARIRPMMTHAPGSPGIWRKTFEL